MKFNGYIGLLLVIILPFLLDHLTSITQLFVIQIIMGAFALNDIFGGGGVLITYLPIYKRVTYASFLFAISRAAMYLITSFGLTYLGFELGDYGLWIITLPVAIGFIYGTSHFIKLEKKFNLYPNLS